MSPPPWQRLLVAASARYEAPASCGHDGVQDGAHDIAPAAWDRSGAMPPPLRGRGWQERGRWGKPCSRSWSAQWGDEQSGTYSVSMTGQKETRFQFWGMAQPQNEWTAENGLRHRRRHGYLHTGLARETSSGQRARTGAPACPMAGHQLQYLPVDPGDPWRNRHRSSRQADPAAEAARILDCRNDPNDQGNGNQDADDCPNHVASTHLVSSVSPRGTPPLSLRWPF